MKKVIKKLTYLLLFFPWIAIIDVEAQTPTAFSGQVLEKGSDQTVAFAHLYFLGKNEDGFVTDEAGKFRYVPGNTFAADQLRVKISAVGYIPDTLMLQADRFQQIFLERAVLPLPGPTVTSPADPARELIRKVIARIPDNYPAEMERLTGLVTEAIYRDSARTAPFYKTAGRFEADKFSYEQQNEFGNVAVLDGETLVYMPLDSLRFRLCATLHSAFYRDDVATRSAPLDKDHLEESYLNILDTLVRGDEMIVKLFFSFPKSEGLLWVTLPDYAILKVEKSIKEPYLQENSGCQGIDPGLFGSPLRRLDVWRQTEYWKSPDNVYRLHATRYRTGFTADNSPYYPVYTEAALTVQEYSRTEKPIPFQDRRPYSSFLLDAFPHVHMDSLSLPQEAPLSNRKVEGRERDSKRDKTGYFEFLRNVASQSEFLFGLNLYQVETNDFWLRTNAPLPIDQNVPGSSRLPGTILLQNTFLLWKKLGFVTRVEFPLRRKQYHAYSVGFSWRQPLGRKGRWLSFVETTFGTRSIGQQVMDYSFSEDFSINGKKFDSGLLEVFALQKETFLSPGLGLKFYPSPKFHLSLSAHYFLPLDQREGVFYREDKEFWPWNRSSTFLEGRDAFEKENGSLFDATWGLSVRVLFL